MAASVRTTLEVSPVTSYGLVYEDIWVRVYLHERLYTSVQVSVLVFINVCVHASV